MPRLRSLPQAFFARPAVELAPLLLNKVLVHGPCSGRIVEVEAYSGSEDAASHGYRGRTERTSVMFGPPGFLYVYFTYGMHYCANVVSNADGVCGAVLLRALAPLTGLDVMHDRRGRGIRSHATTNLASGPAKLCEALAITAVDNGEKIFGRSTRIGIVDDGVGPPSSPVAGKRIGITKAVENRWRFWVSGDPNVSRPSSGV